MKAKIVNACFQLLAAFWAVIVIIKAQTTPRWHAYAIAALGVVVISIVGTRLKHRIRDRQKTGASEKTAQAAS